jgi:hypothetical protein
MQQLHCADFRTAIKRIRRVDLARGFVSVAASSVTILTLVSRMQKQIGDASLTNP